MSRCSNFAPHRHILLTKMTYTRGTRLRVDSRVSLSVAAPKCIAGQQPAKRMLGVLRQISHWLTGACRLQMNFNTRMIAHAIEHLFAFVLYIYSIIVCCQGEVAFRRVAPFTRNRVPPLHAFAHCRSRNSRLKSISFATRVCTHCHALARSLTHRCADFRLESHLGQIHSNATKKNVRIMSNK